MSLTTVVKILSYTEVIRFENSSAGIPVKFQMAAQTGILMSGKMSFGVRKMESTPAIRIKIAKTMKVYGRRSANWTIHIGGSCELAPIGTRLRGENIS